MKAPPGVVLKAEDNKTSVQLKQLAADQKRASELLRRILDRQVVYVTKVGNKISSQ